MKKTEGEGLLSNIFKVLIGGYVVKGMVGITPIMFFLIILPKLVNGYFIWGLDGAALYVGVSIIPIVLLSVIIIPHISHKINRLLSMIIPFISGFFLYFSGLLLNFEIDGKNVATITIFTLTLLFSFISTYYLFYFLKMQRVDLIFGKSLDKDYRIISYFTGLGIATFLISGIFMLSLEISRVFYVMGTFSVLIPWLDIILIKNSKINRNKDSLGENKDKIDENMDSDSNISLESRTQNNETLKIIEKINLKEPSPKIMRNHRFQLIATIFLLMFLMMLYSLGSFTYNSNSYGFALFGVSVGLFVYREIRKYRFPGAMQASVGIFAIYILFYINPLSISGGLALFLIGFIMGALFGDIYELFSNFKLKRVRKDISFGLWFFALMLCIAVGSFLGYELKYVVSDNSQDLWAGFLILGIGALFILPIMFKIGKESIVVERWSKIMSIKNRNKDSKVDKKKPELDFTKTVIHEIPRKLVKICTVTSIILLLGLPLFNGVMLKNTHQSVIVDLGKTMYLVDGTPVTSVDLSERSGVILLNSPNPTGIVHDELIRPGKSIRLGGYFYTKDDLRDITDQEMIEWIGNNCDVYSLGLCALDPSDGRITPYNISQIKALNPATRFYYMAFATTLFEDFSRTDSNSNLWNNSHYPNMGWNSTMDGWTVKLNNGSEAIGIRRESNDDDGHMMDLGSMEWADYFSWIYDKRVEEFGADGVAIDEVMWEGYWGTKLGDDDDCLRDYSTIAEIEDTCFDWLERISTKMNSEIITQAFWDEAQIYQDGIWGEIAFRSLNAQYGDPVDDTIQNVWYRDMNWEGIVNNIAEHGSRNRSYIWAAFYNPYDNNESLEYALSTYLMGKPNVNVSVVFHPQPTLNGGYPQSIVGYAVSNVIDEVKNKADYFDVEMGDALGDMQLIEQNNGGKYWKREFTNGLVLVNPFHAYVPGFQ